MASRAELFTRFANLGVSHGCGMPERAWIPAYAGMTVAVDPFAVFPQKSDCRVIESMRPHPALRRCAPSSASGTSA